MSDIPEDSAETELQRKKLKKIIETDDEQEQEIIEKDVMPHFIPTFRISRQFYPLPIIIVVAIAGILAYLTYFVAGVQVEGGYVSESEYGATGGLINGLIFVAMAAISSFVIVFLIKKGGIGILKYIFGFNFGILIFFLTLFFGQILLFLVFFSLPDTELVITSFYISFYALLFGTGAFTVFMIYKYLTTESFFTKNFIVMYIAILVGAMLGVIMPLWTTLAMLIGFSLWDIYAVKAKSGPIKNMIDLTSQMNNDEDYTEEQIKEKLESGEIAYDTTKLEIGIGDLVFYSMLSSSALILTGNIIIMILTAIAIIIGTGITIQGLKRNKILPGLPISIFLGIGTMLLSWYVFSLI